MHDPLIGQHLGNYRIDSVIGRGGMAVVYFGWDENLLRPVAVKVIDARYREDPGYTERFVQEARSVASWRHDNILQIFYAGQENGLYYFAMEFVDGLDLARVMKQFASAGELMQFDDVLKIGWAVARALDFAHNKGLIHRDVKPSNVMIGKDGRIVLADFGLAMNAQQGSFGGTFGSPHYIAPEQARNSALAVPQSDLYALGVILYEMLTGTVPFDDPSPMVLAVQHLTKSPPPPRQVNPSLDEAVEAVLLKALSKQPADRYQSGTALMNALAQALNQSSVPISPGNVALPMHSGMAVAEQVSLNVSPAIQPSSSRPSNASVSSPAPFSSPASPPSAARRSGVAALLVIGVGLCLLLCVGWVFFGSGAGETITNLLNDADPTGVMNIEETGTTSSPSESPPANEITPANTAVSELSPTQPPATPFEQTPIVQPADTPSQETTNPTPTEPPAAPPAATPGGLRLLLLYNSTSFYVYNPDAETRIGTGQLDFESLDANGQFSGYLFEGIRWAQFYSFLNPRNCVRLEVPPTGWLRPSQCGNNYNATVTPEEEGELVFWVPRDNVAAFRVMWQGEEVGQCDVNASQCEVFLP